MMSTSENPLLTPSELPYQLPPFDRIKDEHFAPAYEQALAQHSAEVAAIATNPAPATFENTLVALERAGELLERVESVFQNLSASHTNPTLEKLDEELAPRLAADRDVIFLNPDLFARVRTVYEQRDQLDLDPESQWLLERYYRDFIRAGAPLSPAEHDRLRELNQELSSLQSVFKSKLLADTNALALEVSDQAQLAGLSDAEIATAAEAGRERGTGGYVLTLVLPTEQPALTFLHDRGLRERLHQAATCRGARGNEHDTREVVCRLAHVRAQRAALLGFPHHAAYQIADRTAGSIEALEQMLAQITPAAVRNASAEAAELQKAILEQGQNFDLAAWDWPYYAEQVRKQRYDVDSAVLKQYLPLERVLIDGVLFAAEQLYGIRFDERHDLPTYHPEVRVFEVFDHDGSPLGLFMADLFTRDSKRGGAWCTGIVKQNHLRGTRPVVVVNMNISRPPAGEAALLTVDEVRTLFHEFGHALHGLFSNVRYPRFGGTSVPRDFVEYPSQVNEMWMFWPEVVANYAKHHETGQPLPAELLQRLREAEKFNSGHATVAYLAATLLDLAWHGVSVEQAAAPIDVEQFEAQALEAAGVAMSAVPPRYRTTYFAHIFATESYSAGYYSYIWSEVLDADSVEWFKENGGLRRENGDWFRNRLLSRGGSVDSMEAFRDFRGREPRIEPLLERRGLTG